MTAESRRTVVAGNWKMNLGVGETRSYAKTLIELASGKKALKRALFEGDLEMILFPPGISIYIAYTELKSTSVAIGAQNVHWEPKGAYTGEISVPMIVEAGCRYALVGHSERRHVFGETIDMTSKKLAACIEGGVTPMLCIGETETERKQGLTEKVLFEQFEGAFGNKIVPTGNIYIAYEPVWAIGTGNTATPDDAESACRFVREKIAERFDAETSRKARILYGGSVNPENAEELLSQNNVDGVLVGGASLKPDAFLSIASSAIR